MTSSLLQCLKFEHDAVAEFLDLLNQEAESMTEGRFVDLAPLAERKSQMADDIALLRQQRENEQVRQGFSADRSGAESAAAAGGLLLQAAWHQLQDCAARAHKRNHANGVMVHTHLDFTRQAIDFLKSANRPLYGRDGAHHSGSPNGRRLGVG